VKKLVPNWYCVMPERVSEDLPFERHMLFGRGGNYGAGGPPQSLCTSVSPRTATEPRTVCFCKVPQEVERTGDSLSAESANTTHFMWQYDEQWNKFPTTFVNIAKPMHL